MTGVAVEWAREDDAVFRAGVRVRTSDVDARGRLRPDAVARVCQDAAQHHLELAGAASSHPVWVIRRMVMRMDPAIRDADELAVTRWCSGIAERWCTMPVTIESPGGGRVETEGFWIHVDPERGPAPIAEGFRDHLGLTATEGRPRWRPLVPRGQVPDDAERTEIPLRRGDFDRLGHVNNAVYWEFLERWWERIEEGATAVPEFDHPIPPEVGAVTVAHRDRGTETESATGTDTADTAWITAGETVFARARLLSGTAAREALDLSAPRARSAPRADRSG